MVGKRKRGMFLHLLIFCLLRFCSTSASPKLISLTPCVATSRHWPCSFSPGFLSFLMHIFKFRKAELKTVFRGKQVLYFHNCMLSIFNAIFGHHNLFVWFCWHVLFWLLRQREQKFLQKEVSAELPTVTPRSFLSSESMQNLTMHELSILFLYGPKRLQ